jgi:hypothetical protein
MKAIAEAGADRDRAGGGGRSHRGHPVRPAGEMSVRVSQTVAGSARSRSGRRRTQRDFVVRAVEAVTDCRWTGAVALGLHGRLLLSVRGMWARLARVGVMGQWVAARKAAIAAGIRRRPAAASASSVFRSWCQWLPRLVNCWPVSIT